MVFVVVNLSQWYGNCRTDEILRDMPCSFFFLIVLYLCLLPISGFFVVIGRSYDCVC